MLKIKQIALEGKYVLRLPSIKDLDGLSFAAIDGENWNIFMIYFKLCFLT